MKWHWCWLRFYFPGTGTGPFRVDRSFASGAADGVAVGAAAGLGLLWARLPGGRRPWPSWVGQDDDEVQVARSLHGSEGFWGFK